MDTSVKTKKSTLSKLSHSIERLSVPKARIEIDRDPPANDYYFD